MRMCGHVHSSIHPILERAVDKKGDSAERRGSRTALSEKGVVQM